MCKLLSTIESHRCLARSVEPSWSNALKRTPHNAPTTPHGKRCLRWPAGRCDPSDLCTTNSHVRRGSLCHGKAILDNAVHKFKTEMDLRRAGDQTGRFAIVEPHEILGNSISERVFSLVILAKVTIGSEKVRCCIPGGTWSASRHPPAIHARLQPSYVRIRALPYDRAGRSDYSNAYAANYRQRPSV